MNASGPIILRPLTIGEMFDRAVTIYVRNFVVFALLLLTVAIPMGFAQRASQGDTFEAQFRASVRTFENPVASFRSRRKNKYPRTRSQNVAIAIVMLLFLAVEPVATNAVAIGVGMLYAGKRPTFSTCLRQSLRAWPRLLGTIAGVAALFSGAGFCCVLLMGLFAAVGFAVRSEALAVVLVVVSAVAIVVMVLLLVTGWFAGSFAYFAVAIEGRGVASAIRLGIQRIYNRSEYRRGVVAALACCALLLGQFVVLEAIAIWLILDLKLLVLQVVVATLSGVLLRGLFTTFVAVYYYDIRIRREGFDLEADFERLGGGTTAVTV